MAIFVALIFQVLFVLFAMAINIGLIVHDKINLQNSVDLAAYYAAQKQAEMLNAIAHQNYQIRQAFKLMAWRYWVLGPIAFNDHPSYWQNQVVLSDEPWAGASDINGPAVCVNHNAFADLTSAGESLCNSPTQWVHIHSPYQVVWDPFGWNTATARAFEKSRETLSINCRKNGSMNFVSAALFQTAYRFEQMSRRNVIEKLAIALSRSPFDFADVRGNLVSQGVERTLQGNLTVAQNNLQIQIYNSLGSEQLGTDPIGRSRAWLPVVAIQPLLHYVDSRDTNSSCSSLRKYARAEPPHLPIYWNDGAVTGSGINRPEFQAWLQFTGREPPQIYDYQPDSGLRRLHSSIGYEKNPWAMAFVGVTATTTTRSPFHPLGGPVRLVARAYAKPFGGRVGPWDREGWARGSPHSNVGDRVDPLLPARKLPGGGGSGVLSELGQVNFSRYPGDQVGLASRGFLSMLKNNMGPSVYGLPQANLDWYIHGSTLPNQPNFGDTLVRPGDGNPEHWMRNLEAAAIAPNVFDSYYYSIDPDWTQTYLRRLATSDAPYDFEWEGYELRPDMGYTTTLEGWSEVNARFYIQKSEQSKANEIFPRYWSLTDWQQLLTGWVSPTATNFNPANAVGRFGQCQEEVVDDDKPGTPGDCIIGGRVGYSVKLVSADYIFSDEHQAGGPGGGTGALINLPAGDIWQ